MHFKWDNHHTPKQVSIRRARPMCRLHFACSVVLCLAEISWS